MTNILYQSAIDTLPLLHRGKVRDVYDAGDNRLLMVTCDRLSAFDVVLPTAIPGKGALLNRISAFWFARTAGIVRNHLLDDVTVEDLLGSHPQMDLLRSRSVVVRKLEALPVEAIVRGYLAGSGWKDYQATGQLCGHPLPGGLQQAARLPQALFTPSTKAAPGAHDKNISLAQLQSAIGAERAKELAAVSLELYRHASEYALGRGIIIADSKFEFGLDQDDQLVLMDELFTPDSSRFWPADQYATGISPPSFDKQYVRDYLETLDWDKTDPGPELPAEVALRSAAKYAEAVDRLTGDPAV